MWEEALFSLTDFFILFFKFTYIKRQKNFQRVTSELFILFWDIPPYYYPVTIIFHSLFIGLIINIFILILVI